MNKELHEEFQRTEKGLGAGQNDYRYLAWLETRAISQAARIAELKAAGNKTLHAHRKEAKITCPEDCWCWDLAAVLENTAKAEKEEK